MESTSWTSRTKSKDLSRWICNAIKEKKTPKRESVCMYIYMIINEFLFFFLFFLSCTDTKNRPPEYLGPLLINYFAVDLQWPWSWTTGRCTRFLKRSTMWYIVFNISSHLKKKKNKDGTFVYQRKEEEEKKTIYTKLIIPLFTYIYIHIFLFLTS